MQTKKFATISKKEDANLVTGAISLTQLNLPQKKLFLNNQEGFLKAQAKFATISKKEIANLATDATSSTKSRAMHQDWILTMKLEQKWKKFAWDGFVETVNSVTDATLPTDLLIEEPNNHVVNHKIKYHRLMSRSSANKHLFKKNVNNQTQLRKPK